MKDRPWFCQGAETHSCRAVGPKPHQRRCRDAGVIAANTQVPVVVLSAQQASEGKVEALDAGADDYVTKPFGMEELLARLRAATRRGLAQTPAPVVETASFTVDLPHRQVLRDGTAVSFTPTEWHLVPPRTMGIGPVPAVAADGHR
jgi:two-component system KDP operon response regulator KdpE